MNTITSYEVIRIINGKALFLADHFTRLEKTLASIDEKISVDKLQFNSEIYNCITKNNIINGNLKVEALFCRETQNLDYKFFEIPHHYPSEEQYANGVITKTLAYERQNPHSKIWNQSLREKVDNFIAENNIFEAIYVNQNGKITEGTRSNVFFIKDKTLISAFEKDILKGVTRKYIIETAENIDLILLENDIDLNDIEIFDAAFISGTSPKILPIAKINNIKFNVENENLRLLMQKFNEVIMQNINL